MVLDNVWDHTFPVILPSLYLKGFARLRTEVFVCGIWNAESMQSHSLPSGIAIGRSCQGLWNCLSEKHWQAAFSQWTCQLPEWYCNLMRNLSCHFCWEKVPTGAIPGLGNHRDINLPGGEIWGQLLHAWRMIYMWKKPFELNKYRILFNIRRIVQVYMFQQKGTFCFSPEEFQDTVDQP